MKREKKAFDACLLPRISLLFLHAQKTRGLGFFFSVTVFFLCCRNKSLLDLVIWGVLFSHVCERWLLCESLR